MQKTVYPHLSYAAIELETGEGIPDSGCDHIRLSVPENFYRNRELSEAGFTMIDRTVEVKVPVANSKIEFKKFSRMPVLLTSENMERVREIARKSFGEDHRFLVSFSKNSERLAESLIDAWIDETEITFQCQYKDTVAGFANVVCRESFGGMPFIRLAAVDPRYRLSGAAVSLYAGVFEHYRQEGILAVYGRISTRNMAVMNLYASFGARFENPRDIYIKR